MKPDELSTDSRLNRRKAYFVMDSERTMTEDGEFIPCIAVEGEPGFFKTNWTWGKDLTQAKKFAAQKNASLGLLEEDAVKIVESTMFEPTFH
jgi:hypothetical protein